MKNNKIVVAVIGAGYWGSNLVRNFYSLDGCYLKYICDLNQVKLDNIGKKYCETICTTEIEDILADSEVDAVAIATQVASHYQLAKKCLESGKHILLEKPMTQTKEQAEELIRIAKEKNLVIQVDHTFLFYGPVLKIKELIDSGELGELYYFDSQRINLGLIQPDVNVIWDLAPHDISILNYIYSGKPVSVSAVGTKHLVKNGKEELAHITIEYENGFVAHIHVSWLSPVKLRQMIIGGDKKMIYFDDIEPSEKIKIYNKGIDLSQVNEDTFNPIYRSGDVHIPIYDNAEALARGCNHFLDCIIEGKQSKTNGQTGLEVVKILEAADKSILNNGKKIII
jgi:predicted dehydrogenase